MKLMLQRISLGLAALFLITDSLKADQAHKWGAGIVGRISIYYSYGQPYEVEPGVWIGVPSVQMPVSASFSVLSVKTRKEVASGTSDANGEFSISLPAGKYILVPHDYYVVPGHSIATSPVEVTVKGQRATPVSICYFQNGPFTVFTTTSNR